MIEKQTRWMKFLGGKNILFTLGVLILVGLTFLLYSQLNFILNPILTMLAAVLTPLIISFILFYLLSPIVNFIEKKGVPRLIAIIGLYILFLGLIVLLLVWLVPILQEQLEDLINTLPSLFDQAQDFATNLANNFLTTDSQRDGFQQVLDYFSNIETNFINYLSDGFSGIGSVISSVTNVVLILFMVPIILFFLLKDGSMFLKGFMSKIPPKNRKDAASILAAVDSQVGDYVKGQILIAIINGVMMFIGFSIIGLNYSGVLAVTGGILSFIPYLGPTLTFLPAIFIALGSSFFMVVKLIIVWVVVQFVEGNLVEPNVMGRRLNVHPVSIIFILLIMGELLGLIGMLIGVPLYAILRVFFNFINQKFQKRYNRYYGTESDRYDVRTLEEIYNLEDKTDEIAKVRSEN